jgi:hypothetical protein
LGLPEDGAASNRPISEQEQEAFTHHLVEVIKSQAPQDHEQEVTLLEEFVAMGLPQLALTLADTYSITERNQDFRSNLAVGAALMLGGKAQDAESFFLRATELRPDEIAPYVNLTTVYYALEADDDAREWCLAGLRLEPNHARLWELLYSLEYQRDSGRYIPALKELAEDLGSYRGLSLVAHLTDAQDHRLRAEYLETLYRQGHRDDYFLIEYTAALGLALDYQKITTIVWERVQLSDKPISWQLIAHGIQAHLAAEEIDQAKLYATMLRKRQDVDPRYLEEIDRAFEPLDAPHPHSH